MSDAGGSNPKTWVHNSAGSETINISTFVSNSVVGCDITQCLLMDVGCINPYPVGRLSINALAVTAVRNIALGWSETVCIKCNNNDGQV